MAMPDEMRPRSAPAPPAKALCAITGQPARYRDPATGLPYADLEAFRELRRRKEAGLLAPVVAPVAAAAVAPTFAAAGFAAAAAAAAQQQQGIDGGSGGGMGLRQSSRLAAHQVAADQQFLQPQAPIYQADLLLQPQQLFAGIDQQQPAAGLAHLFAQQPVFPPEAAGAALPGVT